MMTTDYKGKAYFFVSDETFRISGTIVFGPLDENAAMKGAGLLCNCVLGCVI